MEATAEQTAIIEALQRKVEMLSKRLESVEKDIRMQANPAFYRPGDVRDPKYRY